MGSSTYCKRDDVDTQREDGVVEIFGGFGVGVGAGGRGCDLVKLTSVSTRAHTIREWDRCVCLGQNSRWALVKSLCQRVRCCRYERGPFQESCLELRFNEPILLMRR